MALGNVDLTPQLVQAVRDAVDVVDVASTATRLTRKGTRHEGLCPLHKEKTPSFSVDPERGLFYCFGCGTGGDAIKLHMLLTGDDFPAAIESLALRYGIPLTSRTARRSGSGRDEPDVDRALAAAQEFFVAQLARSPFARKYLEGRRIPPELNERYGLGYAPDGWTALLEGLRGKVPLADLVAAGLVGHSSKSGEPYDRFRHRLMFPIHNASGRLVGFGGRTLGDDKAKYVNTAETERFHKGSILYGLFQARKAIRDGGRAVLVEGYFDALAVAAAGAEGAVASMGTSLTPEQARLLARWAEEVVVAYDGDRAGEEAHRRALPILLAQGLAVYRAGFAAGHDPDSLRLAEGEAALRTALVRAPDAVSAEIERLAPPEAAREPRLQAQAAAAVSSLLDPIPDPVLRYGYGRRAASRLDLPVEMILRRSATGGASGGPPPARPAPAARPAGPPSPVRTEEDRFLRLLFAGEILPPADDLPPVEAIRDTSSRNIYRAFRALYAERGGAPDAHRVLAELAGDEAAVDRLARLLVEEPVGPEGGGFSVTLSRSVQELMRRWWRARNPELAREMADAQRLGDLERFERLLREKTELTRRLHPGAPRQP